MAPVNGCVPDGALEAGYEAGGYVSYIIRAKHEGGVVVGRLTCNVSLSICVLFNH